MYVKSATIYTIYIVISCQTDFWVKINRRTREFYTTSTPLYLHHAHLQAARSVIFFSSEQAVFI